MRFLFNLDKAKVRERSVSPSEIRYLQRRFGSESVRINNSFHAKVYIFDNKAMVTSANLSRNAFARGIEIAALFSGKEVDPIRRFYERLWKRSTPVPLLDEYDSTWKEIRSQKQKQGEPESLGGRGRIHTKIIPWDEQPVNWLVPIDAEMSKKTEREIEKATGWNKGVIGSMKRGTFGTMNVGDGVFLIDNPGYRQVRRVNFVIVKDKRLVKTDEGDYHFAYDEEVKATKLKTVSDRLKRLGLITKQDRVSFEGKLATRQVTEMRSLLGIRPTE